MAEVMESDVRQSHLFQSGLHSLIGGAGQWSVPFGCRRRHSGRWSRHSPCGLPGEALPAAIVVLACHTVTVWSVFCHLVCLLYSDTQCRNPWKIAATIIKKLSFAEGLSFFCTSGISMPAARMFIIVSISTASLNSRQQM